MGSNWLSLNRLGITSRLMLWFLGDLADSMQSLDSGEQLPLGSFAGAIGAESTGLDLLGKDHRAQ